MLTSETVERAAGQIARRLSRAPARAALVIASPGKRSLAQGVVGALGAVGRRCQMVELSAANQTETAPLCRLVAEVAGRWALALLLDAQEAPFLFEVAGRPDRGLRLPEETLYCDWLAPLECTVRLMGADLDEVARFRQRLLAALAPAHELRVTTPAGTDLSVRPRHWLAADGEVFTAPQEGLADGHLVIDGSLYSGPLPRPAVLEIVAGRVANADDLDRGDPRLAWLYADLTRDAGANVVAELGLGIHPAARAAADLMEAEQARGTCHFGFGHNLPYGGANESATHVDGTLLHPTITADGRAICTAGVYPW